MKIKILFLSVGFFAICFNLSAQKTIKTIRINAGEHSRKNSIICFNAGKTLSEGFYSLVDKNKNSFPVQISEKGYAYSIIDIPAGETKSFNLVKANISAQKVEISKTDAEIKFIIQGKQAIGFQTGKRTLPPGIDSVYLRGGYIHPVLSPSGLQVSDDYPLNHKHHHGIWAAWTKTEFEGRHPDFWNMGDKTGTVLLDKIKKAEAGVVFASLQSQNFYIDKMVTPNKKVLNEDWEIKVYNIKNNEKPYYLFDVELKQQCASASPLKLPEYLYGGLGFRGNRLWDGEKNTFFLTSEGKDRKNAHATKANWCHMSGNVEGKPTGITIMSHPDNFCSPQPMRIHPSEPFFCFAPPQSGEFSIKPGETYTSKYRFIVMDGEPDVEFIKGLWNDYANPVKVIIQR